jgi:hypothetical protein
LNKLTFRHTLCLLSAGENAEYKLTIEKVEKLYLVPFEQFQALQPVAMMLQLTPCQMWQVSCYE